MKTKPATLPASPATASQNWEHSQLTGGKSPLPSETLLRLGTLMVEQQVAGTIGDLNEAHNARGVQAGIVATLHEILPPAQFRDVMIQWDVDAIKLSELLHIAGASSTGEQTNSAIEA